MHVPRFGQREWEKALTTSRFLRCHGTTTASGGARGHPCCRLGCPGFSISSMDERLERGLWVLCPMRTSMVGGKEPGLPGQRSPRDGD